LQKSLIGYRFPIYLLTYFRLSGSVFWWI